MYKFLYILILIASFSCKTNSVAQENTSLNTEKDKVENTEEGKPKIEIPGLGDPWDNEITNMHAEEYNSSESKKVYFSGSVIEFFTTKIVCEKPFKAAIKIKVDKINKFGSGVTNLFSEGQEMTFVFEKSYVDTEALQKHFNPTKKVTLVVQQNVCSSTGKEKIYEIVRFNFPK
ncbi:hypothetical protein [Aquimarina mytili]|uniref:Lipoprotein n=1 Tax=Aquimarina mytili TaxID=874423 RepID=A0A937D911_9FLAO|nr:hypothetical protein [Aquimarina mytili]MBL0684610.1 hypothetical protein [Aquimarina mytili]